MTYAFAFNVIVCLQGLDHCSKSIILDLIYATYNVADVLKLQYQLEVFMHIIDM
jgi:hypothetical protein